MIRIEDGFYQDPYEVREWALAQEFNVSGNYPGLRTECVPDDWHGRLKDYFEFLLGKRISHWPKNYNSAFQYTTEGAKTWVHHDETEYAAVVYLTPNAPLNSGTSIFQRKDTGIMMHEPENEIDYNKVTTRMDEWNSVLDTKNIFNRMILYPGKYYHCSHSVPGFGTDKHNGRLFQTFFFDT